jgi:alpha-beta hydrolase superfamily lysophospholipase
MWTDFYYDSCGCGQIHACVWAPGGEPKAIIQIIHGIAEHAERYDHFAEYLTTQGYMVVAEDHMGHGKSIGSEGTRGYFHGGWFNAVNDCMMLMNCMKEEFPGAPYILFGHSMGSFMARTILAKYPDCGLAGAIICGTGWQPKAALPALIKVVDAICKKTGERNPSEKLDNLIFGSYNKRVEHKRTPKDWLTRDNKIVDAYIADPLCGFVPSCGLLRDMMMGILYIEQPENLAKMDKKLPVWFIAGKEDPVGDYGKGVVKAADAFRKAGMEQVDMKLYPLCRHEIHNEINKEEVYEDVAEWIGKILA